MTDGAVGHATFSISATVGLPGALTRSTVSFANAVTQSGVQESMAGTAWHASVQQTISATSAKGRVITIPELDDVVTGEVVAAEWGNQIRDRTVQRYIDADERDTLNPTPSGGDLAYLADIGVIQTFDGANWVAVGTGEFLPLDGGTVTGQLTIRRSSPNTFTIINEADGDLDGYRFQFRPNDGMEIRAGSPDNNPPVRVVYEMNIGEFVVHSGFNDAPVIMLRNTTSIAATHDFRFNLLAGELRLQASPKGTDTWTTLDTWTAP